MNNVLENKIKDQEKHIRELKTTISRLDRRLQVTTQLTHRAKENARQNSMRIDAIIKTLGK
jgi:hypothetical protein